MTAKPQPQLQPLSDAQLALLRAWCGGWYGDTPQAEAAPLVLRLLDEHRERAERIAELERWMAKPCCQMRTTLNMEARRGKR